MRHVDHMGAGANGSTTFGYGSTANSTQQIELLPRI
jgi:hypothetical protein